MRNEKLKMLAHPWSTQINEAMHISVASYAPKTKKICGTLSIKTSVGVTANSIKAIKRKCTMRKWGKHTALVLLSQQQRRGKMQKLTAAAQNPKGTPKELWWCAYDHPIYCTTLGLSTASSK